jgi:TolB-like protein/Tfp pilus assembly protein PilF
MPDRATPAPRSAAPVAAPSSDDGATGHRAPERWRRLAPLAALATAAAALAALVLVGGPASRAVSLAPPAGASSATGRPVTLAVLPFTLLAPHSGDDYLAVGIPDVLITRLASSPGIRVRPTSAILRYADGAVDARTAGRALAVRYVLTGTVARADSSVRVRAQLVAVDDGDAVWGREYRLAAGDLARFEDSVTAHVLAALRLAPDDAAVPRLAHPSRSSAAAGAAYDLFLEGRVRLAHHRESETRAAIAAFEGAIGRDSGFALAWAGLATASAEMELRFASTATAPEWGERAETAARRALELDPALPEAHEALAAVYRKAEFDWHGTIVESRRALALNPSAATPHFYSGGALYHLGLLEEAEREVREGLESQPVSDRVEALRTLGTVALASGRYAQAVSLLQAVQRMSDRPVSDPHLAAAYFYAGDGALAERVLEGLVGSQSGSAATRARAMLASILASRGERRRADSLLAAAERGTVDHHVAYSVGVAYAQLGRPQVAVRWLRTAWDTGFRCYPWYARDPLLAPLRDAPEFRAMLEDLKTSWESEARWYHGL